LGLKVAPKILKRKERNCACEDLSLRCGATKKKLTDLGTCALQRNMPNSAKEHIWIKNDIGEYDDKNYT
jgi:hypothetical protein